MHSTTSTLVLALTLGACAAGPQAKDAAEPAATHGDGLQLSSELRAVLLDEMRAIDGAMPELRGAVESGDLEAAARLGDAIADTFILRQKLTRAQHHELHHSVPRAFLKLDHAFHHRARELATAAREARNADVATHLGKLEAACGDCHQRFGGPDPK